MYVTSGPCFPVLFELRDDCAGVGAVVAAQGFDLGAVSGADGDFEEGLHRGGIQVIAQDRIGLLHRISSRFSYQDCNIEIALIDTEGQKAIDVFYLTEQGKKLTSQKQELLREALQGTLG